MVLGLAALLVVGYCGINIAGTLGLVRAALQAAMIFGVWTLRNNGPAIVTDLYIGVGAAITAVMLVLDLRRAWSPHVFPVGRTTADPDRVTSPARVNN